MTTSANNALRDFNNSISQFGDIESAANNFVTQKKNEVYNSWRSGILDELNITEEQKQRMDEALTTAGVTFSMGKGLYGKYKAYQAGLKSGGKAATDSTGATSSASDGSDIAGAVANKGTTAATESSSSSAASSSSSAASSSTSGSSTAADDAADAAGDSGGVELSNLAGAAPPLPDELPAPTSGILGGGENVDDAEFAEAADLQNVVNAATKPAVDLAGRFGSSGLDLQNSSGGAFTRTPASSTPEEAEDETKSGGGDEDAEDAEDAEEDVGDNLAEDAGEEGGDLAASAAASGATEAAGGVAATLTTAAEGAGAAAAVGVGDLALSALGPVGMAVGLGLTLADIFGHHSDSAPAAPASVADPYIATAFSNAGGFVLPSENSALDLVGGHSAF